MCSSSSPLNEDGCCLLNKKQLCMFDLVPIFICVVCNVDYMAELKLGPLLEQEIEKYRDIPESCDIVAYKKLKDILVGIASNSDTYAIYNNHYSDQVIQKVRSEGVLVIKYTQTTLFMWGESKKAYIKEQTK
jgi:hypothetical protein